jgi:hypothetical protein
MPISKDLFLAILALDSYNRNYNERVFTSGNQIGNAVLGSNSSILTTDPNDPMRASFNVVDISSGIVVPRR